MTLNSVVLPAPLGPMMPSRSPARTSRLTARTAVRPPKRLVTASSVSTRPPRPKPAGDAREPVGRESHDEDQHDAVDDQVDPGEARLHLATPRGDTERLGGILVLAHAGQLVADARALEIDLQRIAAHRDHEDQVEPRDVAEAQRPEPWPVRHRHALRARGEAAPAARHDF